MDFHWRIFSKKKAQLLPYKALFHHKLQSFLEFQNSPIQPTTPHPHTHTSIWKINKLLVPRGNFKGSRGDFKPGWNPVIYGQEFSEKSKRAIVSWTQFSRYRSKNFKVTPFDNSLGRIFSDFRKSVWMTFKRSLEIALIPENTQKTPK